MADICTVRHDFPHLIAGPIISYKEMLPQFIAANTSRPNFQHIGIGMAIFSMGLFKKAVIADELSPTVADVFSRADSLAFLEAWIGAIGYAFQMTSPVIARWR